jgi:L,D-transpeptidase-like protein
MPAIAAEVAAGAAVSAASPAAPGLSASGAAISAAAPPSTAVPGAAASASAPSLAALTPPGGGAPPMAPTWLSTPAATTTPSVSPSAPDSAGGTATKDQPTLGVSALRNTKDPSIISNPYSWSVMIFKSQHRLVVYYRGHLYKEYHAVFGRNLDPGTKLWAGDRRTPEGAYTIIAKRLNSRWRYFLKLDYPNSVDRARYEQLVSEGEVPRFNGRAISAGDGIGIHGTDDPILNTGNVNWTTGCISVDNGAIDELETLLPVGTLVVIKH